MGLFGKSPKPDPRKQVREWESKLRREAMMLDRQIRAIERAQNEVKASLKKEAKKGNMDACKIYAKEIVNSRKAISRIHATKAQMNSIQLSLNHQLAHVRISGVLERSAEVMKAMNNLVKVSEISSAMQELSREMMKAGMIEEMIEETMDEVTGIEEDEMEEAVAAEVDKVLFELTEGQMGKAPIVSSQLPQLDESEKEEPAAAALEEMEKRLEALKS